MIVYRQQHREADPARLLGALQESVSRLGSRPSHDTVVSLVLDLGVAEAAILDALHPDADDDCELDRRFGAAALSAGHLLVDSWRGRGPRLERRAPEILRHLGTLRELSLPARCTLSVPEGYAYYGVWPEAYAAAATRLHRELRPVRAWCLGLRNIGTSLSAVVASTLQAEGCPVLRHTLRPRGHPFDRRAVLREALTARLRADAGLAHFLIVDEGPGLSGSSIAGVAEALSALGVPDERIVLLPSWTTDGRSLKSEVARRRWPRHPQFVTGSSSPWPAPSPPAALPPGAELTDVSAGRWRAHLLPRSRAWPAVHPQHERRKLMTRDRWLAFAGLGRFGIETLALQTSLADAGFTPRPFALDQGMLVREMVPGTPLAPGEADGGTLARIADYLAYRRRTHPAEGDGRGQLADMVLANVGETGVELVRAARARLRATGFPGDAPAVAVDGRMQPQEWLRSGGGLLKVDATDHHADHFFPGCGDIAWDLAGAMIEFRLTDDGRATLTRRYRAQSGDRDVERRLPGYLVAYLAFRIGYASLAEQTLAGTEDGVRFAGLRRGYLRMLQRELRVGAEVPARA